MSKEVKSESFMLWTEALISNEKSGRGGMAPEAWPSSGIDCTWL